MDLGINFTGAFLVKNPPKVAKEQLNLLAGKRRQIFENFDNTTDVFYVVRPIREENIAKFILENNLHFKYFPNITTKSKLDPLYPHSAVKAVNSNKYQIDTTESLAKKFNLLPEPIKYKLNVNGIISALNLKASELSVSTKDGVTYAFSKDGKHVFKASANNKFDENYVYYNDSSKNNIRKLLIRGDRIILEYPQDVKYFEDNFNNALIPPLDVTV